MAAVMSAMDGVHTPMGLGMAPSLLGIQFALAGTVSVLPAALGGLTMMAAGTTEMTEPLVRRLTWFNAVWVAGYFAVNLRYQGTAASHLRSVDRGCAGLAPPQGLGARLLHYLRLTCGRGGGWRGLTDGDRLALYGSQVPFDPRNGGVVRVHSLQPGVDFRLINRSAALALVDQVTKPPRRLVPLPLKPEALQLQLALVQRLLRLPAKTLQLLVEPLENPGHRFLLLPVGET